MSASHQSWTAPESRAILPLVAGDEVEQWFALQTRARHEKVVAQQLRDKGIATFLPLVRGVHRWSDRRKIVELPLFSCYVFAKSCRGTRIACACLSWTVC